MIAVVNGVLCFPSCFLVCLGVEWVFSRFCGEYSLCYVGQHVHFLTLYGCFIIWCSLSFHTPNMCQTHLVIERNSVKDMLESVLVWPPASAPSLTRNYTCAPATMSPGHKIGWSSASLSLHKYNKYNKYRVFLPQKFHKWQSLYKVLKISNWGQLAENVNGWFQFCSLSSAYPKQWICCLLQELWYCRSCRKHSFKECLVLWERLVSGGVNQKDFIFETTAEYIPYKFCH